MYYELYIDVLFLVNFMMDYLLLLIVKRILKCSATHGNICIGSLAGSFMTCVVIAAPFENTLIKFILFHFVISLLMLKIGLGLSSLEETLRGFVTLYISGFLLGGILTYLHQYVRTGSLFFGIAVLGYQLAQWVWSFIVCLQRFSCHRCRVTLYFGGAAHTVDAIIDTGNSLRDPVTGKPVCVVEKNEIYKIVREESTDGLRTILFHTIGKEQGEIPVIELTQMCVHNGKEYWIDNPVIGICGERISAGGGYGMILNPDIF